MNVFSFANAQQCTDPKAWISKVNSIAPPPQSRPTWDDIASDRTLEDENARVNLNPNKRQHGDADKLEYFEINGNNYFYLKSQQCKIPERTTLDICFKQAGDAPGTYIIMGYAPSNYNRGGTHLYTSETLKKIKESLEKAFNG